MSVEDLSTVSVLRIVASCGNDQGTEFVVGTLSW